MKRSRGCAGYSAKLRLFNRQQFPPRRGKAVPGTFFHPAPTLSRSPDSLGFCCRALSDEVLPLRHVWQIYAPPPAGVGVLILASPRLARHVILGGKFRASSGVLHWLAPSWLRFECIGTGYPVAQPPLVHPGKHPTQKKKLVLTIINFILFITDNENVTWLLDLL